jgi:hypothetical protein
VSTDPTQGIQPPPADANATPDPTPPPAPADSESAEQEAAEATELEQLKAKLAAAEQELQAVKTPSGSSAPDPNLSSDDLVQEIRDNWPQEGGMPGVPQPWDLKGLGLDKAAADLDPGADNTVSPIVIAHKVPNLTFGSADQSVHELGRMLGAIGFPNSVSRGENPFGAVDPTVMAALVGFRNKYGVVPDPSGFGGDHPAGRDLAASHIDPWTVEAIYRVYDRTVQPRGLDALERQLARG